MSTKWVNRPSTSDMQFLVDGVLFVCWLGCFSDSKLYISTDYGKTFKVKDIKIGSKAAILNYIYQSPANHQKVITLKEV